MNLHKCSSIDELVDTSVSQSLGRSLHTSLTTCISVLILVIAAAAVLLLPVYRDYQKKQQELAAVKEELNDRKEERTELSTEVTALGRSPEAVEKVAREKFGLVREGETVFRYDPPARSNADGAKGN